MSVYTYTAAKQNLAQVLDEASGSIDVYIKRKNGQLFKVEPVEGSGLDVPPIKSDLTTDDLVSIVRAMRSAG